VDAFIANSEETRNRIRKHYSRESIVINPPIDIDRFTPGNDASHNENVSAIDYYLIASRPVPYKRIDVAVDACIALNKRAIVVGGVPKNVRAASNVELRGHVSDEELVTLMRGARALLFPQLEDFGMTPLEMMACGRPVIAYGRGGACETVVNGTTGLLVPEQTPEAFAQAIIQFETQSWNPRACRTHAEQFSAARFRAAIRDYVTAMRA
jgi:glycosyltransferase involved in cell wall biosynthesis